MLTMGLDWRGRADFSTKVADLYSVYWTNHGRPVTPVTGAVESPVLVAWQPVVMFTPDGEPSAAHEYNLDLYGAALGESAMTDLVVTRDMAGYTTRLVDITKRRMVSKMIGLRLTHYAWAQGDHLDYFTPMSWQFPELESIDAAWSWALNALANGLRGVGRIAIGQQFHPASECMALNGQFWEVDPTSFGQTMESHTADLAAFRSVMAMADPGRRIMFVSELRQPSRYPAWYIAQYKSFVESNGLYACVGRDAMACTSI